MSRLKLKDKVIWRGAWGTQAPKEVIVKGISLCTVGSKYGKDVKSVDWKTVEAGKVVVSLDNNHWAYGHQLTEIK
jgi:hypothetical protein